MSKKKTSARASSAPPPGARSSRIWLWIVLLIPVAAAGWFLLFHKPDIRAGSFQDYNVLLITLDTVRADHLPAYGYKEIVTPNLDQLAQEGWVFEDAIAHVPLTLPSHASILTGRLPVAHGIRDNAGYTLGAAENTLAEVFRAAGYATAAFVSASVLDARWQLNQGFDIYDDSFPGSTIRNAGAQDLQRRAEDTALRAEQWIRDHASGKQFAWVHFYDPHDPYEPPEPYRTQYAARPYDGEIAYTDAAVGRLLRLLKDLQLMERTIIILTADHGEGLGEHDEPTHGMFLYNTTQHVPLLVRIPGAGKGRIKELARHIDVAPTLLDLVGLKSPAEIQGKSLLPLMNGKEKEKRVAYSESLYPELHYGWSPLASITTDQYRYIRAPRPELFDRKTDPSDAANLSSTKASIAKVLDQKLTETMQEFTALNNKGPQPVDPETEEKLRALGYIGSTTTSTEETRKIDPKDKTDVSRRLQEASSLLNRGMYEQALQEVAPVLKSDPGILDAHTVAGLANFRLGKPEVAVDEFLLGLQAQPSDAGTMYNLAFAYELSGKPADAEFWYLKALERNPSNVYATLKLAHLYASTNQALKAAPYYRSAATHYEALLQKGADDMARSELHATLADIYVAAGEARLAEKHYSAAVDLAAANPDLPADAFVGLGLLYRRAGRGDLEAGVFRKMVQSRTSDPRGYFYLGKSLLESRGNLNEIISLAQKGLSLNPALDLQVFGHYLLGNAFEFSGNASESQKEYTLARELEKQLPPR